MWLLLEDNQVAAVSRKEVLCPNSGGQDGRAMFGSSTTLFNEQQHYGNDHESRYCKLDRLYWTGSMRFEQSASTTESGDTWTALFWNAECVQFP